MVRSAGAQIDCSGVKLVSSVRDLSSSERSLSNSWQLINWTGVKSYFWYNEIKYNIEDFIRFDIHLRIP